MCDFGQAMIVIVGSSIAIVGAAVIFVIAIMKWVVK